MLEFESGARGSLSTRTHPENAENEGNVPFLPHMRTIVLIKGLCYIGKCNENILMSKGTAMLAKPFEHSMTLSSPVFRQAYLFAD